MEDDPFDTDCFDDDAGGFDDEEAFDVEFDSGVVGETRTSPDKPPCSDGPHTPAAPDPTKVRVNLSRPSVLFPDSYALIDMSASKSFAFEHAKKMMHAAAECEFGAHAARADLRDVADAFDDYCNCVFAELSRRQSERLKQHGAPLFLRKRGERHRGDEVWLLFADPCGTPPCPAIECLRREHSILSANRAEMDDLHNDVLADSFRQLRLTNRRRRPRPKRGCGPHSFGDDADGVHEEVDSDHDDFDSEHGGGESASDVELAAAGRRRLRPAGEPCDPPARPAPSPDARRRRRPRRPRPADDPTDNLEHLRRAAQADDDFDSIRWPP